MAGKPRPKPQPNPKLVGSGRDAYLFTKERREAIIDAIRHRIPYQLAAEANGIDEETLFAWIRRGKRDKAENVDTDYVVFSECIKRAEMTKVREHLDMIAAKPERWQADAWILERRWHQHFGPNAQLNELNKRMAKLEMENGHPLPLDETEESE